VIVVVFDKSTSGALALPTPVAGTPFDDNRHRVGSDPDIAESDDRRLGRHRLATETGQDVAANLPADVLRLDLSVGAAGLIVGLVPGEYDCYSDRVTNGSESAVRCLISGAAKSSH